MVDKEGTMTDNEQNDAPNDVQPEDPVTKAYARTGRSDNTGVSGIAAGDEAAGDERRKLYEQGATLVSRID
jgi:hypothetical protein